MSYINMNPAPSAAALTRRQLAPVAAGLFFARSRIGIASPVPRVGDQKGGAKSLMTASGVLAGIEPMIEWNIFAAAAPLLEALNAGAIDCGGVGDAPFAFARAAGVKAKVISRRRDRRAHPPPCWCPPRPQPARSPT